jgi:hypothetical protein
LWIEPPSIGDNTPSIGVVFVSMVEPSYLLNQAAEIVTCSLYAGWKPVELYIQPSVDNFIHSPSVSDLDSTSSDANYPANSWGRRIKLGLEWENSALPANETVGELTRRMMRAGRPGTPDSQATLDAMVGTMFSILVVDVLSRLRMEDPRLVEQNSFYEEPGNSDFSYYYNINNTESWGNPLYLTKTNVTEF